MIGACSRGGGYEAGWGGVGRRRLSVGMGGDRGRELGGPEQAGGRGCGALLYWHSSHSTHQLTEKGSIIEALPALQRVAAHVVDVAAQGLPVEQ